MQAVLSHRLRGAWAAWALPAVQAPGPLTHRSPAPNRQGLSVTSFEKWEEPLWPPRRIAQSLGGARTRYYPKSPNSGTSLEGFVPKGMSAQLRSTREWLDCGPLAKGDGVWRTWFLSTSEPLFSDSPLFSVASPVPTHGPPRKCPPPSPRLSDLCSSYYIVIYYFPAS